MEDMNWKIPSTYRRKKHSIAITFTFSEQSLRVFTICIDTACYDTAIEKNCIYCDDLYIGGSIEALDSLST